MSAVLLYKYSSCISYHFILSIFYIRAVLVNYYQSILYSRLVARRQHPGHV